MPTPIMLNITAASRVSLMPERNRMSPPRPTRPKARATLSPMIATALAFDALTSVAADTYRVTLTVDDAAVAGPQLAAALPAARVVTMPIAGDGPHQIVVELPDRVPVDAAALGRRLTAGGLSGLRAVEVEDA